MDGVSPVSYTHLDMYKRQQQKYPVALYVLVHSNSHSLKLALAYACSTQTVRNCIGTIQLVVTVFRNSTKNNNILKKSRSRPIRGLLPASLHTILLSMCKTRWVYKHETILRFKDIFVAIVHALQELEGSVNRVTSHQSQQLVCAII